MQIAFVAPFDIEIKGTVNARMLPIASELSDRGYDVTLVIPPWDNPDQAPRTTTLDGVPVRFVKGNDTPRGHVLATQSTIKTVTDIDPDLIHSFKPIGTPGLAALWFKTTPWNDIPVVIDSDDWEGWGGHNERSDRHWVTKYAIDKQEKWIPPMADAVTVASRTLQTQMWGNGVDSDRVWYVPNGQNPERFDRDSISEQRIREKHGLGEAPVVLLYTRFFEFDIGRIVEIFRRVHELRPSVQFLIVGEGRNGESQTFAKQARMAGLVDVMTVTGWVESEVLPEYLAAGDIAVYPMDDSLINRAKCPAKLTELMLLGIPLVAEEVGQVGEYMIPGETGYLYQPYDVDGFVSGLVELVDDEHRREEVGEGARKRILTEFGWDTIVDNIEEAYENALKGN